MLCENESLEHNVRAMKTAAVFPGQASQFVGMCEKIHRENPKARKVFDMAEEITGMPIRELCFKGPEHLLTRTDNAQPSIVACSLAVLRVWDGEFHLAMGHSLGEYSSLAAAGVISFEDALALVKVRGQLMAQADQETPGTMAAVIGMSQEDVQKALDQVDGTVILANINAPGQLVISGETKAVEQASELLKQAGARRVIPLKVSAAFHSPLMEKAAEAMREEIAKVDFKTPKVPVVPCATAKPTLDPDEIKNALSDQLTSPVPWIDMVQAALKTGVESFVEVGPGKVLQGLIARIAKNAEVKPALAEI